LVKIKIIKSYKMYKIVRLLLLPIGLLIKLFALAKQGARDLHNKYSFNGAIIDKGSSFTTDSTVGQDSHILSGGLINHSHIGKYTYCGKNAFIQNTTIGNYCSIANDVVMGLGAHPLNLFSTSPVFYKSDNTLKIQLVNEDLDFEEYKAIIVGSDVWIGARVIIMDGVTIGHGAVVAAGAVVTKDIPPYAIVGGIPAKIIKYRFRELERENLLISKWWEGNPENVYAQKEKLLKICESTTN